METESHTRSEPAEIEAIGRIQGVIFDADGTLYNQSALRWRIVSRIARAHWNKPAQGVRVILTIQAHRKAHEELRNQPFSSELQLAATAANCGYPLSEVRATVDQWFERAPLSLLPQCVYPRLPKFLQLLSELGIKCGVFSDYPADVKISAMAFERFFTHARCASEVGRQKPDPTGLLRVAQEMGVAPENTLCIGDRSIDLEAAANAGMQGFLVEGDNSYSTLYDRFSIRRHQQEL